MYLFYCFSNKGVLYLYQAVVLLKFVFLSRETTCIQWFVAVLFSVKNTLSDDIVERLAVKCVIFQQDVEM